MISPIWIVNLPVPQEGGNIAPNIRTSQILAPSYSHINRVRACWICLPTNCLHIENVLSQKNEGNIYEIRFVTYYINEA